MLETNTQTEQPIDGYPSGKRQAEQFHVFNIQRTCVYDGPGIRTTLFFKGCGLRCLWCQNPEALSATPAIPSEENYSTADIMAVALRDKAYYDSTGGGITLSGGDPLLQDPDRLIELMTAFQREQIHVAVETALHVPGAHIEKIAPFADLFLVDLKVIGNDDLHKKLTGRNSRLVHENIKKLISLKARIRFRMVIVPGHNDGKEEIQAAADFLTSIGYRDIELLKYHHMYEDKARRLGLAHDSLNITPEQSLSAVKAAVNIFSGAGINAVCLDLDTARHQASFSPRVYEIQDAIRKSDHYLCLEVSRLKTEFYKKHGFKKPAPVHRAERLSHVLHNKKVIIYPRELLVGNFTSKRKGGQVWEEHYGTLFLSIIHQINRQKPVPFQCSLKDKLNYYFKIFPFWARRSLLAKVNRKFSDLIRMVSRCSEMNAGFNNNMAAIAHFIVNFDRLLALGTDGIIKEIEAVQTEKPHQDQDFYQGAIIALRAVADFATRYADALARLSRETSDPDRREELETMAEICRHVPRKPARTFHEALQSMIFLQIALCIESYENAVSHGRLDQILYPYYKQDLAAGRITDERAKELLALYILKMDEAILVNDGDTYLQIGRLFETMSTDQTVTIGGLGRDGKDATNALTYMLLDICELQPYAVNMTARIHRESPAEYLDRMAEVYINGAPMPALYNDELYVDTLLKHYNTTVEAARNYSIIGCVEPNASDNHFGNTDCANMNLALPFLQALKGEEDDLWNFGIGGQLDKLAAKFIEYTFRGDNRVSRFIASTYADIRADRQRKRSLSSLNPPGSMEELLERFQARLNHLASSILADHQHIEAVIRDHFPTPLTSAMFKSCIENGRDANDGGATFNSSGIQGVGITDVADSLFAIDEVVFKKKMYTLEDIIHAVENDFEGERHQAIREALLTVKKFGHDDAPQAVEWVNKTLEIYVNALNQVPGCPRNGIYTAGYYALNVNDVYGAKTPALPSGRKKGVSLANSITPHYGMETTDLLSSLNSVAGVDFVKYAPNGTSTTFTVDSALFQGPAGIKNLAGIFSTYFKEGGMQFQPNVIDRKILLEAYENPEKHRFLLVRVAGYCAYFNDLSDELKQIIINRTCYS
ncbi:MAG: pyruvate formate lyase family protein [Thermodesulfobacteriota bacterium]|nr:pyruvate formate lyase family protein [Thermodesulfobacteriota bacterium]